MLMTKNKDENDILNKQKSNCLIFLLHLFREYMCACMLATEHTQGQRTTCRSYSFLLPRGSQGLNSGPQARKQVPLATELVTSP